MILRCLAVAALLLLANPALTVAASSASHPTVATSTFVGYEVMQHRLPELVSF